MIPPHLFCQIYNLFPCLSKLMCILSLINIAANRKQLVQSLYMFISVLFGKTYNVTKYAKSIICATEDIKRIFNHYSFVQVRMVNSTRLSLFFTLQGVVPQSDLSSTIIVSRCYNHLNFFVRLSACSTNRPYLTVIID